MNLKRNLSLLVLFILVSSCNTAKKVFVKDVDSNLLEANLPAEGLIETSI